MTTDTNRLFVNGVDKSISSPALQDLLTKHFAQYGAVKEVFVPDRSTKPYAFITFESHEVAQAALAKETTSGPLSALFSEIKAARVMRPSTKRKRQLADHWQERLDYAQKANVLVQVHQSHRERLLLFLKDNASSYGINVGAAPTESKTVYLIFFHCSQPEEFVHWLESHPIASTAVNATYIIGNSIIRGSVENDLAKAIFSNLSELPAGSRVRLSIFPPSIRNDIFSVLDMEGDDSMMKKLPITISPQNPTHIHSILRLDETQGTDQKGATFLLGISVFNASKSNTLSDGINKSAKSKGEDGDICRAYHKLHEAFERYSFEKPSHASGLVALDCGAAPGGWTKYISETLKPSKIYSIDPGMLAPTVLSIPEVEHLSCTIEKAIPQLLTEGVKISLWVSDMCLKEMENQVTWFLAANDAGILAKDAFFVLTLKCTLGHATHAHDRQALQQVNRMSSITRDVQIIHLFANRKGERTVMGYLSS